jgi:hypothetical protein
MNTKKHKKSKRNTASSPKERRYRQYVLETIWAGYAGAAVGYWHP